MSFKTQTGIFNFYEIYNNNATFNANTCPIRKKLKYPFIEKNK